MQEMMLLSMYRPSTFHVSKRQNIVDVGVMQGPS